MIIMILPAWFIAPFVVPALAEQKGVTGAGGIIRF